MFRIRISIAATLVAMLVAAPAAASVIGVHETGGVRSGFKIKTISTTVNTGTSAGNGALIGVHFGDSGGTTEEDDTTPEPDPVVTSITLGGTDISGNQVASVGIDGNNTEVHTAVYYVPGLANGQSLSLTVSISNQKAEDFWGVSHLSLTDVQQSAATVFDTSANPGFKNTDSVSNSVSAGDLYVGFGTPGTKTGWLEFFGSLNGSSQSLTTFTTDTTNDPQRYFGTIGYFTAGSDGTAQITMQPNGNDSTGIGVALTAVPEPASAALLGLGGLLMLSRRRASH